ncbi:MAG: thioredoxin domain-containing protein [Gammaproteobacteria bacterium]|nr:thioredoxin domain-containing protein [Gammaproteobacteria bacterium]
MTKNNEKPNRLEGETSPYLQQHAANPVDWYPWGEEALRKAREEDKPILLSVGYSACHWCHVMAHESFEDDRTASLMNELFVNIKVDREERPDIDKIYQTAHQLLTQRGGGWPLTMFINPEDQRPFFGGTYFPNEARYGMPSFGDLLRRVAEYYRDNKDDVRAQGEQLSDVFVRLKPRPAAGRTLDDAPLRASREALAKSFDREFGGFGAAPKFPHPTSIDRVLRHWHSTANGAEPDVDALFMASLTLTRMAEGGIYDQLGGGFCRYSVDRYWQIPHFEKMLYDNGPLLALYAQAHAATGEALFERIANETADWILADMRSPDGGFYSTRDADSEGHEGRFFVWSREQIEELLTADELSIVTPHYGLDAEANFEGYWHLTVHETLQAIAKSSKSPVSDLARRLASAKAKLLAARCTRVWPARDEKQLTSWNALAIRGLAIAGRALGRPELTAAAGQAADFIRQTLIKDGRLYASYKDGRVRFPAYLDDHAFLLDALLELLQSDWQTRHLEFAMDLADLLLEHFYDRQEGGFYFTADDHETLIDRPKPLADEAVPSGNGIAAFALQRLGFLLGETRFLDATEKTLQNAWQAMREYPHGHVSLITALEEYLEHPEIIVIRGDADEVAHWRDAAAKLYAPARLVFAIERAATGLPGVLDDRRPLAGETVAYRCKGTHCSLPLTSFEALATAMREPAQDQ